MMQWLMDEHSLTKRLIGACSGNFSVQVLNQTWIVPTRAEQKMLAISTRHKVLLRQVILYCGVHPVVFAHSLIPIKTLKGQHRRLGCLGNKPLGKYLFSKSYLRRSALQWSLIKQSSPLHDVILAHNLLHGDVWGRRSLFHLKQKKLLVSEYFLPAIKTL